MRQQIVQIYLFIFLTFNISIAQESTGILEGRILQENGTAVVHANILLSSESMQGTRGTITNEQGYFYAYKIPAGNYDVRISFVGKQTTIFKDVNVQLGRTTTLGEVILKEGSQELSEVIVTSTNPVIDPSSTTLGLNLEEQVYQNLPIQRDYKSLMSLSPLATESYYSDGVNISGSTGWENVYYIDGINVTDPMRGAIGTNLPYNFIREIEIKSGGYEAEYGSALGGIANVITHQGGNQFHGQVFGFFTDQSFAGEYRLGTVRKRIKDFTTYDVGLSFGGPIIFDKLWYYIAYNPTFQDQDVEIPDVGIYKDRTRSHLFAGKLTWQLNPKTNVVMTLLGDPTTQERVENQLGVALPTIRSAANPDPYLGDIKTGGYNLSINVEHIVDNNFFIDGSISFLETEFNDIASTERGLVEPFYMDFVDENYSVEGGYGRLRENQTRRISAKASATYFSGSHILKFGLGYEDNYVDERADNKAGVNGELPTPIIRVLTKYGIAYQGWWGEKNVRVHNRVPSIYLQDSWFATNRLRINAGIRWDGQFLVGSNGYVAQKILDQWQPRIGLVYQLNELGSQKVFASFGRFYEQLPLILTSAYFSNDVSYKNIYYHDPRIDPEPSILNIVSNSIQPEVSDLEGQHFDEFIVGYERKIGTQFKFGVKGIYRNLRQVVEDGVKQTLGADGKIIGTKLLGNPGKGELDFLPRFTRKFSALQITFQKPRGKYNFLVSYVLSRSYGNYPGLFDSERIYPDANLGNLDLPIQLVNATGLLANDRTHVFKIFGSYNFDFGLSAGTSFNLQSGTPLNAFGPVPPNDLSSIIFHVERGSAGRTPTIWDWNVRLSYDLGQFTQLFNRFKLLLDVFHLLSQREAVLLQQQKYASDDGEGNLCLILSTFCRKYFNHQLRLD